MAIKSINGVVKSNLCIGCGMCTNFTDEGTMKIAEDGALKIHNYKHNSNKITEEELVKDICPGVKTFAQNDRTDYLWGNINSLQLGYSSNKEIRYRGSSGGTITQTLVYLLDNKIVDYVIHIENDGHKVFENKVEITDDINKVIENTGSRYCPSAPLENILKSINTNKKYAIVARPCDTVAIENYLIKNENLRKNIIYKIAFFCAGAPSMKGTEKIVKDFNLNMEDVKSFRYRGNGWPGFTTIIDKDNKEYKMSYDDSWGKVLNRYLPTRCKVCPDGVGMEADIVFGDGWKCDEKGYPIFSEGDGKSLVITRSKKGEELKEKMIKDNVLIVEDFEYKNLKLVQPYQYTRRSTLPYRLLALKLFGKVTPTYEKNLSLASKDQTTKAKSKAFLGTVKRVVKKRF